ncbi:MAG: DUF4124 domain-containing protein [Gammaproteobacteria bacterium]
MTFKNTLLCFTSILLVGSASAEQMFKWVDKNGVTHYGDAVPAEYAGGERQIINEQGVTVERLDRERTEEELVAEAIYAAELKVKEAEAERQRERDRILLDTYLSVEEIAMLRDRRLLAIEAQVGVIRQYLGNLQERWEELETETRQYNFPYSETSELPPLPEDLAQLIIHTERAMAEHMQTVQTLRHEQNQIKTEFAADAERFKQLKANSD